MTPRRSRGALPWLAAAWIFAAAGAGPPSVPVPATLVITPESFVEGDLNTYAVANGSHTAAYDPANPTAVVHANSETVAFLIQVASLPALAHGNFTVRSSDPATCAAKVCGPALRDPMIRRRARRLFVSLECLSDSAASAVITVTVDVVHADNAHAPVSFGFRKRCAGGAAVPGFDVSLGAFAASSDGGRSSSALIMHNGEARPEYDPADPTARVSYDTADVHMYIASQGSAANGTAARATRFGPPTAESSAPWCRVMLSGAAAPGGEASASPLLLVLKFDCSGSGVANVTVTLPLLPAEPAAPAAIRSVRFGFFKECKAGDVPGFDVTLSSYEPGVRASYAVKNGEATSAYRARADPALPLAVVREAQSRTSFYLQMSGYRTLEFEPPVVTSSDAFCLVSASGDAASGGWVDDIPSQLVVNFNCVDSGSALVTVAIPLRLGERTVAAQFAFRKECRWTSTPGFDITLGAWIRAEGGTYAVRNGAATPPFSLWEPKAVVRASEYSSMLFLHTSTAAEQEFSAPTAESSDPAVKVTLGGPASRGGTARPAADKPLALQLGFDCMKSVSATVTVTVPLGPWNEAAFSFVKVRQRALPHPSAAPPTPRPRAPRPTPSPRAGVRRGRDPGLRRDPRRVGARRPPLVRCQERRAHRGVRRHRARGHHPRGHALLHLLPDELGRDRARRRGALGRGAQPGGRREPLG